MEIKGSVVSIKGINVQTSNIPIPSPSVTNVEVDGIPNINISAEDGKDGKDGKSAYEQAVEGGFKGTEQEFTDALNGNVKGIDTLLNAYDENIALQLQTIIG
jgi:hypothetical protein